jgi:very-short-patch-repair endonuclease
MGMAAKREKPSGKSMTEAERRLWSRLRSNRAFGGTFEREVSVGHYVVDFASLPAKLVVEVDDGQITGRRAAEIRAIYLNALGWRVVRIWHSDIDRRPDAILHTISEAINPAAPPNAEEERPSPVAKAKKKKIAKKRPVAKKKKNKRKPRRKSPKKG